MPIACVRETGAAAAGKAPTAAPRNDHRPCALAACLFVETWPETGVAEDCLDVAACATAVAAAGTADDAVGQPYTSQVVVQKCCGDWERRGAAGTVPCLPTLPYRQVPG